jgi:hypothetical protein
VSVWNRSRDLRYDANPAPSTPRPSRSGRLNRLALASLCCGIASYLLTFVALGATSLSLLSQVYGYLYLLPPVTAIGAIVTGHIARGQIRRTQETGSWQSTVGLLLGYLFPVFAYAVLSYVYRCIDQPSSICSGPGST